MYGLETSVLVPLLSGLSVHNSRPFFPADLHAVLQQVPKPRILITTPVHLRACVTAIARWPRLAYLISATAPLVRSLAIQAEQVMEAPVLEIYGCTETGSLASRHTAVDDLWELYPGIGIDAIDGRVSGCHLGEPVVLNDVIERRGGSHFQLLGRRQDLVNVAGKRASLIDLNRRLAEIAGVEDGVFIAPDEALGPAGRLAALVVAPTLSTTRILAELAERVDPVFLPRPLRKVARLPRNETGKLPRRALLELLRRKTPLDDNA
jgi:acyl-coenzyme A synthetase/AMP-(fatty) acid ligase